jgi:Flp pilus assembly protein TadB
MCRRQVLDYTGIDHTPPPNTIHLQIWSHNATMLLWKHRRRTRRMSKRRIEHRAQICPDIRVTRDIQSRRELHATEPSETWKRVEAPREVYGRDRGFDIKGLEMENDGYGR